MTRIRSRTGNRSAFTLIELLVVIAIIAVLVSLTAAGVFAILNKIPEVQTRTDMSQMDAAMGAFMADYKLDVPPPSLLVLREDMAYNTSNPVELRSYTFLRRIFGKNLGATDWNQNGTIDSGAAFTLQGEECLVFYLGGVQSSASGVPQCLGFSKNSMNPAFGGGSRNGPYFQFNSSRLVLEPGESFFSYLDAWKASSGPKPYLYFSSYGVNNGYSSDCPQFAPNGPYATSPGVYTNSNTYQIISAGKNGVFGGGLWSPSSGATGAGADDQANFSAKILGAGQQ